VPVYLDHNATSPLLPAVRAAMVDALDLANPSSPHGPGRAAAMAVDHARRAVAAWCGADPRQIVFTSGATEANAMVLRGLPTPARPRVLASAVEHPSVGAWASDLLPVDREGRVDLAALDAFLGEHGPEIAVVSVMAANNESGVLQPIEAVAARCTAARIPFHCDATQLFGRLPAPQVGDFLTFGPHKGGGPKGVGALRCRSPLPALLQGGPQERGRRAGTENVAAIVGFGEAARQAGTMEPSSRLALEAAVRRWGGRVLGEGAPRLPNTVLALFPYPGDLIVMALDLEGVAVSTGSACASGAAGHSHVLRAMGEDGIAVRFSTGPMTAVGPALAALDRVMERLEG
jgi:cysteine desulfurase